MEINFETIDFESPANKIINDIFNHSYSEKYNRDYEILGRTAMFEYVNELLSLQYISKQTKETIEKIYDNLMGMSQEELILFYFEICQDSSDDSYFAKAPRPLHYSFFKYSTDRKIKIKYEDDCTLQVLYRISNKENSENKVYFGDYFDALMIESKKNKQEDLKKDNFYKNQTKKGKDDYSKIIFGCKEKLDDLENDSADEFHESESTTLKNNESELFSKINGKNPEDLINIK